VKMPLQLAFRSKVRSDALAVRFQRILSVPHVGRCRGVEGAAQTRPTLIDCLAADGPRE
jgi:hypothetical protein